jgi:hypothetical protein
MKTLDAQDGIRASFYSPQEYRTNLGGSLEGEFVAAMECSIFHYEDAQDDPLPGLPGVWRGESEMPDAVGRVATELFEIPQKDIVIDNEVGVVLLKRWPPELFETTYITLQDVMNI